MKRFSCGDVVPGCSASWTEADEQALLAKVAEHAAAEHGMTEIPDALVADVRARIVTVG